MDRLTCDQISRQRKCGGADYSSDSQGEQIAGGYVHEVEPGLRSWIAVLDFKSMYPSIMIANNICSTTLVEDGKSLDDDMVSPSTGTRYRSVGVRRGLVPRLLSDLMKQRDDYKNSSKQARSNGDEQSAFLNDKLQFAVKILMNSFYGVFASSFYRFTHKDIGASITGVGQIQHQVNHR